jgi:hypothetical protein
LLRITLTTLNTPPHSKQHQHLTHSQAFQQALEASKGSKTSKSKKKNNKKTPGDPYTMKPRTRLGKFENGQLIGYIEVSAAKVLGLLAKKESIFDGKSDIDIKLKGNVRQTEAEEGRWDSSRSSGSKSGSVSRSKSGSKL